MAIKQKNVLTIDYTSEVKEYDASKKTALNLTDFTSYILKTDGKILTLTHRIYNTDVITVKNISGLKYVKKTEDTEYKDLFATGLITYTGTYKKKKGILTGTNFNDTFDNDTEGQNDSFKGGKGTNKIKVYTTQKFGNDTIILTKGENLKIVVADVAERDAFDYCKVENKNNDLILTVYNEKKTDNVYNGEIQGTITVKNYFKKDVITSSGSFYLTDKTEVRELNIRNLTLTTYMDSENYTKSTFTGYWASKSVTAKNYKVYDKNNQEITADTAGYEKIKGVTINLGNAINKNLGRGSIYADTIKGGNNKDEVWASKGNDTYKLGKGADWIGYTEDMPFNNDTVYLTKGETMTIDFKNNLSDINPVFTKGTGKNGKNDLIITTTLGKVTLKNYYSKDTGATVIIKGKDFPEGINLAETAMINFDEKALSKKGVLSTSVLADNIDLSDLKTPTKVKKGVMYGGTINSKSGNDIIKGTDFADSVNGDKGNDVITGGKGNDTLTGGKGNDTFIFNVNDGTDVITDATKDDTIIIADDSLLLNNGEDLRFIKNGKNLEIFYGDDFYSNNKIVIKNYFKTKADNKIKNLIITNNEMTTDNPVTIDLSDITYGNAVSGKFTGTNNNDTITGGSKADTIKSLGGNDIIFSSGGNDKIYGGEGDDIINAGTGNNNIYYSAGDGDDTILFGGGTDTIVFDKWISVSGTYNENDLILTYKGIKNDIEVSNTVTIKDYADKSKRSVKYIQIGNQKYFIMSEGEKLNNLSVTKSNSKGIFLADTMENINHLYSIESLSGTRKFSVNYLKNGRLIIDGNYININAGEGQEDDLTILGDHNKVNTGDMDDIVRIGGSLDSDFKSNFRQSNFNTVKTGAGDDYVVFCGVSNNIDMEEGDDYALSIASIDHCPNVTAETVRDYIENETSAPDGIITSFNQGSYGGDCRFLSILQSFDANNNFSEYIGIDETSDNYTVTFKKFSENEKENSVTFAKTDLTDFKNVYGDMDVVIADYALNKLLEINNDSATVKDLSHIETASYNTLAKYIYGEDKITVAISDPIKQAQVELSYDYKTRLEEMWELYINENLSNLTVGVYEDKSDYELGIITEHAYFIKDMNDKYISLINVWDNKDVLNLSLTDFYNLNTNTYSFGLDYYNENLLINNYDGDSAGSLFNTGASFEQLHYDTVNWLSVDLNSYEYVSTCTNEDNNIVPFITEYTDNWTNT